MSMINNISSSIGVVIFGRANLAYALIVAVMSAFGAIPGILLQQKIVDWTGRPSTTVLIMLVFIVFSMVANPVIATDLMLKKVASDLSVTHFGEYC